MVRIVNNCLSKFGNSDLQIIEKLTPFLKYIDPSLKVILVNSFPVIQYLVSPKVWYQKELNILKVKYILDLFEESSLQIVKFCLRYYQEAIALPLKEGEFDKAANKQAAN